VQHISDLHSKFATPCVEVWQTSDLWPLRLGEEKKKKIDRKKLQGKNIMAPLLHRAAIIKCHHSLIKNFIGSLTKQIIITSDVLLIKV